MTRLLVWLLLFFASVAWCDEAIDTLDTQKVSFTSDVLPILQKNCLACHNESEYEGELIMESVELLLNGGDSGPAVIPGKADESLLYQLAKHETDPVMPPEDNDVGAKQLTTDELAVLASWINGGALDEELADTAEAIQWQPIPDKSASVLALEVSPDGRWLATGRGNQLAVYSISNPDMKQTLIDESIHSTHPNAAHLDSVQSVAWNADQTLLASGGYRVVKIWQWHPTADNETASKHDKQLVTSDGSLQITIDGDQTLTKLTQVADKKVLATIKADVISMSHLAPQEHQHGLQSERLRVYKADVESAKKRKADAEKDVKKAEEEIKKATEDVPKKKEAIAKAQEAFDKLAKEVETHETKKSDLEAKIKDLTDKASSTETEDKTSLNEELKKSKQELQQAKDAIKKKSEERDKSKKELEKSQQAYDDAKKAVERSTLAKERLKKSVVERQSDIEASEEILKKQQTVFDESTTKLEANKKLPISKWKQIILPKSEDYFVLENDAGQQATFSIKDGQLIEANRESLGGWKLFKTIGNPNGESPFSNRVTALAFRGDGKLLAVGGGEPSRSGELQLWNTSDWSQAHVVEDIHSDVVYDLQFAPLGNELVSCASDRMMKLINSDTGKHIRTFEGHTGHVLGVSWRADGRTLATAGADQVVKVWDAKEGGQKKTISGFKEEITAVRYLGLENRMVFSTAKGHVHSRDSEGNGKKGFGQTTDYVHRVSSSRDGKIVAAAGTSRVVRVWDAQGKLLAELK